MKKLCLTILFSLVLMVAVGNLSGFAYIIDGNLTDWGVTPFSDWTPDSASVDYNIEDNTVGAGSDAFNEKFDLEGIYFDDDSNYLYFAIVSSNPYGRTPARPQGNWASEDLAIDLNGDGKFEYGADIANVKVAPTDGGPIYGRTKGIYSVDTWKTKRGVEYRIDSATQIGTYEIYNRYIGKAEPGVPQHLSHTYILEGRIPRSLFGNISCGTPIQLLFARVTCLKDWISVEGYCEDCYIPEPASIFLLGSALFGLGGLKFRRKFVSRSA